jgi:hypothetical protein
VRYLRLNVANSHLEIRIDIFGCGTLKMTLGACICTVECGFPSTTSIGVGKPHWRLTEERSMMRVVEKL